MPDPPPPLSAEDARLFRESVGKIRRLRIPSSTPLEKPRPAPQPRQRQAAIDDVYAAQHIDDFNPEQIEVEEELAFLRSGYSPKILRRLKRGRLRIQNELDLHDLNITTANTAIYNFLEDSHCRGLSGVKIIHGKGLRSRPRGPVLKKLTDYLLRRNQDVVAFASARPAHGGTGAVIVLLKRLESRHSSSR